MKICFKCKNEWKGVTQPDTHESCLKCGADLHCCFNCKLYDRFRPHQCTEENADPVQIKERFNFCEFFEFKNSESDNSKRKLNGSIGAKEAFDKLFKKR